MSDRDRQLPVLPSLGETLRPLDFAESDAIPMSGPLVDSYGRRIKNLRVSVTDKCNFRCVYCMPADGLPWLPRSEILTFEEIARLSRVMVGLGVEQLRLTGGEPLVRRDLHALVRMLADIPGLRSLSVTTNGVLLARQAAQLAEAGLTRINVSLDSLVRERFAELTRRDALAQVLAGLEALEAHPAISPIKINAVAMRDFTESEVVAFAHLARRKPYVVRWIEFMPLDADQIWRKDDILTGAEIKALIEQEFGPLVPVRSGDPSETARRFTFADGQRAILQVVRSHPPDGGGPAAHLPLRAGGDRSARPAALGRRRRGAGARDPRGGLAQGVEAPHRRYALPAHRAVDVHDWRMISAA
jgi:cyclic pyranopterin phosphate synthase